MAGAGILDSEAAFTEKLAQRKLTPLAAKFAEFGWTTYATFAMASEYVVGQGNVEALKTELYEPLLKGTRPELKPAIKLLFIEANTLLNTDLARQASRAGNDTPVAIPNLEREARRQKSQKDHTWGGGQGRQRPVVLRPGSLQ